MVNVPAGVYKIHVEKDEKTGKTRVGVKLVKPRFDMPPVIFGEDLEKKARKVKEVWDRDGTIMGMSSIGQKGTGKSTLVELVANLAIDSGYPVLLVDEPYTKQIVEEATRILGDCVFLGDEFEKIFSARHDCADELLTFFSDKSLGKVLFLITSNDIRGLSDFMIHRPGRFLFKFEFEGVTENVVRQVSKFFKVNDAITEFIVKHAAAVTESIDSVIALCKNGHHCKDIAEFKELFEYLNVKKPSFKKYTLSVDGVKWTEGIENRFKAYITDGKWSIVDSANGMTYDKSEFSKRGSSFVKYVYSGDGHIKFEMNFTEFSEPQEMQTDIPVTVNSIGRPLEAKLA